MRPALIRVCHDGHARNLFVVRRPNRQRIDVDGQPPRQRRDAVQHARLVLHVCDQCLHDLLSLPYSSVAAVSTSGLFGRRIISCSDPPAGTIGYTESSCSTRKSINTGSLLSRAERIVGATSAREVIRSPRIPNAFANAAKSGATRGVAT